jgi:hypothetical protein
MKMNDIERLIILESAIKKISEMPLVKGIGHLENMYNSVIHLAKDTYTEVKK